MRKATASGSTQYLYFGGNIIAEKNLTTTGSGYWSGYFNDIAIVSSDGSVYPLFSQNDTATFSAIDHSSDISTINYELNHDSTAATYPFSVHYYHGDQIGSSRSVTIIHPKEPGAKLNVRTETHPITPGGQPVRHVNVERVEPGPKNRPIKKSNTHITE